VSSAATESTPTALIVDDTPTNLSAIAEFLDIEDLRILLAPDGEQALRLAEQALPDIILLDVIMPKMDGFEVCRRLKSVPALRDIPVIFMTALSEPREKIRGFEAGGVDFVTKPIEIHELRARVAAHLRLHTMQKSLERQVTARTAELAERNRQLHAEVGERRRLQQAFLSATDNEQRRLAQELHDGLGQDLAGLSMLMQGAMKDVGAGRSLPAHEIERMSLVIRNALKACHDIAHGLSPLAGLPGGLTEALTALKRRLGGPPGPTLELQVDADCAAALSSEACDQVYRIAQEAVTNAIKHARAKHVKVRLRSYQGALQLEVEDDGSGLSPSGTGHKGLGLHTMQDRAASLGANLQLIANAGGGTTVICRVPR
jgi:signal transduction histidine kinase